MCCRGTLTDRMTRDNRANAFRTAYINRNRSRSPCGRTLHRLRSKDRKNMPSNRTSRESSATRGHSARSIPGTEYSNPNGNGPELTLTDGDKVMNREGRLELANDYKVIINDEYTPSSQGSSTSIDGRRMRQCGIEYPSGVTMPVFYFGDILVQRRKTTGVRKTMGSGSQTWVSEYGKTYIMIGIETAVYNKLIAKVRSANKTGLTITDTGPKVVDGYSWINANIGKVQVKYKQGTERKEAPFFDIFKALNSCLKCISSLVLNLSYARGSNEAKIKMTLSTATIVNVFPSDMGPKADPVMGTSNDTDDAIQDISDEMRSVTIGGSSSAFDPTRTGL